MKITFVLANVNMSGGVRVIATHARNLMKRGHDVSVVSTAAPYTQFRRRVASLLHGKGWPRIGNMPESHLDGTGVPHKWIPKYRAVTDKDVPDADVVVATWWETAEWVSRMSPSKGAKAYFIQHYETWGGDEKRVDETWRSPLHKIVISHWLKDFARDKFHDSNVSHVPNSVDMSLFNAPPRARQAQPSVGLLYNPQWFKGCDVAIKAFNIARESVPNAKLISFGHEGSADWCPLPPDADFTLLPPQQSIKDIYARCDVWLCGSRAEGFHLPPLEAMACRCPVVSTRVGGPMDTVVDGLNGYLVDIEDPAALADRLVKVMKLSDPQWQEMSNAAYATACRYTWKDAAALMEQAFEKAVALAKTPRRIGA